jgi:hypothetical protein
MMIREHLIKAHPERDGAFRWRGDGVSRIEGLSDAVFGFAITLLVVSLGVPKSFDELVRMIAGFPAFVAAAGLLVMVWLAQYRFFRRYGLEDARTIFLNVVLLCLVVFFVYHSSSCSRRSSRCGSAPPARCSTSTCSGRRRGRRGGRSTSPSGRR